MSNTKTTPESEYKYLFAGMHWKNRYGNKVTILYVHNDKWAMVQEEDRQPTVESVGYLKSCLRKNKP